MLPTRPVHLRSLSRAARYGYPEATHRAGRGVAQEDSRSVTLRRRRRHRRHIRGRDNIRRAAPPRQLLSCAQTDGHARRAAQAAERAGAPFAATRVSRSAGLAAHQIITEELERDEDCYCSDSRRGLHQTGVALHGPLLGELQVRRPPMVPAAARDGRRDER